MLWPFKSRKRKEEPKKRLKQAILVRRDLKMPKGKLAAQVAHASVEAVLKSLEGNEKIVSKWRKEGMKKVVLKVDSLAELRSFKKKAKSKKIACAEIADAGRTFLKPGTISCLAIGPDYEEKVDELTKSLKML